MREKKQTGINTAIEEAAKFGFTRQLVAINGALKKAFSNKLFLKTEFAIVKTYRVNSAGTISYVVLNDGTLGYLLKETKKRLSLISIV